MTTFNEAVLATSPLRFYRTESGGSLIDLGSDGENLTARGGLANDYSMSLVANEPTPALETGVGKYADSSVGGAPVITGDCTLAAIVKVGAALPGTNAYKQIISMNSTGNDATASNNTNYLLQIRETGGDVHFRWFHEYGGGNNESAYFTALSIEPNTRYHVIAERNTTTNEFSLWVNGEFIETVSYTNETTGGSTAELGIMADPNGANRWTGAGGSFVIWNKLLTANERDVIFAAAEPTKPGNIVQYTDVNRYTISPGSRGAHYDEDSGNYYVICPSGDDLKCYFGPNLNALSEDSVGLPASVTAEGMGFGCLFGSYNGDKHVWIVASLDGATDGMIAYTAELTPTGLGPVTSRDVGESNVFFAKVGVTASYDSGGEVTDIYGVNMETPENIADQSANPIRMYRFDPDLGDDDNGGTYNPTSLGKCNLTLFNEVSDGFLMIASDSGNYASDPPGTRTMTMETFGGTQTESGTLVHEDQDYPLSTVPYHHVTTIAGLQSLADGKSWVSYHTDVADDGRYGKMVLEWFDNSISGSWHNISSDLFDGDDVWHHAMAQTEDGTLLMIAYVKNEATEMRGRTIYGRAYNPSSQTLSAEVEIGHIRPGYMVDVIMLPATVTTTMAPLVWTEHDGTVVGGSGTGGNNWIMVRETANEMAAAFASVAATLPNPLRSPLFNPFINPLR